MSKLKPHIQCLIAVLTSLLAIPACAQHLQLITNGNKPATQVRVVLSSGVKKSTDIVLVTDEQGKTVLPTEGYPYRILIHDISYEELHDTINGAYNKVIWLQSKMMDEVVITGQYQSTTADKAVQRIEVMDRKKIDAMAAQNLRDVLTNQLEVRLDYDPIFGSSMNMQGSKNYGADAKILIDGVPVVGKQNGAVDLSQINLANIERVEIVKGPMSVSYGTDAIAGTVNLITKKQVKGSREIYAGTYYETPGVYNMNVGGGFRIKEHSIRLDGFRNFFGGWKPGAEISFFDFSARPADTARAMLWKPREQYQGALQYIYTHGKTAFNYKSTYFYELITNRGTPMLPYYEMAIDNRFNTWRKDNAVFVNSDIGKGRHINAFIAYNAYKRIKEEIVNDLTTLKERMDPATQDTSKYSEINSRGVLTTGSTGRKLDYEVGYDVNVQFANSTQIEERKQEMGNYALYGSAEYRPLTGLTIRPGVRYGYNTRYTAPVVPSLNLMYKVGDVTLRASYARGFRQPGLKDLYFDFVDINHNIHGNPDLRAEYSNNYLASASYRGRKDKMSYRASVSAYYNKVHDLITLVLRTGGAANEYWYMNIEDFTTKGVQGNVEFTFGAFNISAGSSLMGTYNPVSQEKDIPAFSYSPEGRASVMYTWRQQGFSVAAFYKFTGNFIQYTIDDKTKDVVQSQMSDYSIADVTVSKRFFKKQLNVSVGCKNLFDVTNIVSYQSGGAHSGGSGMAAIGMGRYYFLKTDINLSK